MSRSSAWFISYDLRPGKQIERRIVLDTLQAAKAAGFAIEALPLIGMGGVRFIDFLLANRTLGMKQFTSLEHDPDLIPRCDFNKPFHNFPIFDGSSSLYIEQVGFPEPSVVWFDYERGISTDLRNDVIALAGAVRPQSFIFITASAEMPEYIKRESALPKRLAKLQQDIDPFGLELRQDDLNTKKFHVPAARILRAMLSFGFSGRADGKFFPYLRLNYKDTTWMMTVGGYFGSAIEITQIRKAFQGRCDFLKPTARQFVYIIEQFNITDAERRLFDRASIATKSRRSERMALKKLGFRHSILSQYGDLMRFIPRYFESVV
jgi:hypothetical protein